MMEWRILGLVFLVLLAACVLILYKLALSVAKPRFFTVSETSEQFKKLGFWRNYEAMEKEELKIDSYDGYILHATYIPAEEPGNKFVIISHGYTVNRIGCIKYMNLFHELGYHCLIYDIRSHGDNRRGICTLGKRECGDLLALIRYVYRRFGNDIYLGLHGESMGAALQIMALKEKPRVKFVINDCGFARMIDVATHNVNDMYHLPKWMCYPVSYASMRFFGFSYTELNPIDALKDNEVPICFMHGKNDTFIPYTHSEQMHAATKGYSELHLFPGAEHAMSLDSDEAGYLQILRAFLEKIKE